METYVEGLSIPIIVALVYGIIEVLKQTFGSESTIKKFYPLISGVLGIILGIVTFIFAPDIILADNIISAAFIGLCSGLSATGTNQIIKKSIHKSIEQINGDDNLTKKIYITGDKHRHFQNIIKFCKVNNTTKNDVMIILGDAGINYYQNYKDTMLKKRLSKINITLFCIHGNREMRPGNIPTYKVKDFCGGTVYYEETYPNILFAKDGQVFEFGGHKCIVIGGAHSVDKQYRIDNGYNWWSDEQPSYEIREAVRKRLYLMGNKVDVVLSHTCPFKYEPTEMLLSNNTNEPLSFELIVDKSTESWLDNIEEKIKYLKWYCGHYHVEKKINKIQFMFKNIEEFIIDTPIKDEEDQTKPDSQDNKDIENECNQKCCSKDDSRVSESCIHCYSDCEACPYDT